MERWLSERNTFYASMPIEVCTSQHLYKYQVGVVSLYFQHLGNSTRDPQTIMAGALTELLSSVFKWEILHQHMRWRTTENVISWHPPVHTYTYMCNPTHMNTHTASERFHQSFMYAVSVSLCSLTCRAHEYNGLFLHWTWLPKVHFLRSDEAKNHAPMRWSLQTPGLAE